MYHVADLNATHSFWELAIPILLVIIPAFTMPDIERMIHYTQKKWAARKVEKVCFYLLLVNCTLWISLLTYESIRKSVIAPRKRNNHIADCSSRQCISPTHSFLSRPHMTSTRCTNSLLFRFWLSDPIWISRFQWHIHSFGYILGFSFFKLSLCN